MLKIDHPDGTTTCSDTEMPRHEHTMGVNELPPYQHSNIEYDPVNHPSHYLSLDAKCPGCERTIECIDVTRHLSFNLGNAIKYIWRASFKGKQTEDLQKSIWYIKDFIDNQYK